MADLTRYYDPATAEAPTDDFAPIPPGWYDAEVEKIEERTTRAGDGTYLNVQFRILGPSHANRVIFEMYTMENPNPKAVQVGHSKFRQLHEACGMPHITNTDQIIGRTCAVKVSIEQNDQYGDKNRVKAARAQTGGAAPAQRSAAPAAPPRAAGPPRPAGPPPKSPPPAGPPRAAGPIRDEEVPY